MDTINQDNPKDVCIVYLSIKRDCLLLSFRLHLPKQTERVTQTGQVVMEKREENGEMLRMGLQHVQYPLFVPRI